MKRLASSRWAAPRGYPSGWLAALGLVMLAFAALWWLQNERYRGVAWRPPAAPIPWADVPQGGVNLPGIHLEPDPAVVSRTLDLARDAGIHWLRVQFPWEDLEIHAKGDFRDARHDRNGDGRIDEPDIISAWAKYDALVAAAEARGLELIVRLDRPPAWARQNLPSEPGVDLAAQRRSDPGETGPPDRYEDYGDYVAAVVGRYRGRVRFFQIWNEPNLRHEWNWGRPDPADFVRLLKIGYERAKAANPDAVVLFPSLSPADGLDWKAQSDLEYLAAVYEQGGAAYFDIFSAQGYGLGQPPEEHRYVRLVYNDEGRLRRDTLLRRPLDSRADVGRVVLLREIMERYGDGGKAVWISEFGWNSHPGAHSFGVPVSEEQKAAYLAGMLRRAREEWPWMGAMNVWFLRGGAGFDPADPTLDFQLVRGDWSLTPAYGALQAYLTAPRVVGPGAYGPGHPAWNGGTLRVWGSGARVAAEPGRRLVLALDGGQPQTVEGGAVELSWEPDGERAITILEGRPALVEVWRADAWWLRGLFLAAPFALFAALWLISWRLLRAAAGRWAAGRRPGAR